MRPARVLLAATLLAISTHGAAAQAGAARGVVARADSHGPLPYSVVSVVGTTIERFADDSGRFVIDGLPKGPVRLLIRHIGFSPREIAIDGDGPIRVELERVAVSLAGVLVQADRGCTNPGAPSGPRLTSADSLLSVAVEQIVENGRQYRLVTQSYPFVMTMRQWFVYQTSDGFERGTDNAQRISSDVHWDYKPGRVITTAPSGGDAVNVPTIAVFAEPAFLRSHCFSVDSIIRDSVPLLAISFRAAESIKDVDLDGTIYLDPATFIIRRSLIRLSRISSNIQRFSDVAVDTHFEEIYPGVPIVTAIDGTGRYAQPESSRKGTLRQAITEHQRVLALEFSRGEPGDSTRRRRGAPTVRHLDRIVGVYDDSTGNPIAGATIRDTLSGAAIATTATGTARLAFVFDDHAVIRIVAPGYTTVTLPVQLSLRQLTPVTIVLHRVSR